MVLVTWFEYSANIHVPEDHAKACWAFLQSSDIWVRKKARGAGLTSSTLPCGAHSLVLQRDLSPGLEGRETARGLDLPVMPYDRPLPSLTPSNMTPSEGLSAYWLKNQIKRLGRRCPRKLSAAFCPGGNKERYCEKKGNGRSLGLSSYKNNK